MRIVRWQYGTVDRAREHFELSCGSVLNEDSAETACVAVIGEPVAGIINVELLVGLDGSGSQATVDRIKREIAFYLFELNEPDPWRYAKHHCSTLANVYSDLHWTFTQAARCE